MKIKAGLWNVNTKNQQYPSEERAVSQIVSHPEFVNDGKQIKNDIVSSIIQAMQLSFVTSKFLGSHCFGETLRSR